MMKRSKRIRGGFTLVELLIVIGIIIILIGITLPVVSKIRIAGRTATSQQLISTLMANIENYHNQFGHYPGPLADEEVGFAAGTTPYQPQNRFYATFTCALANAANDLATTPWDNTTIGHITGSENLVLGLLGGLRVQKAGNGYNLVYDPALIGNGPLCLNPNAPKKYGLFGDTKNLSWRSEGGMQTGQFKDDAGSANDTIIPEFVDTYSSPLPILYLRARVGEEGYVMPSGTRVDVIAPPADPNNPQYPPQQYALKDILGYTSKGANGTYIGEGRSLKNFDPSTSPDPAAKMPQGLQSLFSPIPVYGGTASTLSKNDPDATRKYKYPFDAYAYFEDPANRFNDTTHSAGIARAKDRYILICAGPDRVYGTADDICSFGSVIP